MPPLFQTVLFKCLLHQTLQLRDYQLYPPQVLTSTLTQPALKWWLGIDMFGGSRCPSCSTQSLDPLGHHAPTCRYNGVVVSRHNQLRNTFFESCRQAGVGRQMEVGNGLGHDERRTRPVYVLVPNWDLGKPAGFDLTVASHRLIKASSMKRV